MDIEKLKRKQSRLLDMDTYAMLLIPIVAGIILVLIILTAVFTWTSAITIFIIILFVVVFFGLYIFRIIVSYRLKKLNQKLLDYTDEVDD